VPEIENGTIRIAAASPYHNPVNGLDVNGDSQTTPMDVLWIINYLNLRGPGVLPVVPDEPMSAFGFLDTNADGQASPHDVLLVINGLNSAGVDGGHGSAEAEKATAASIPGIGLAMEDPCFNCHGPASAADRGFAGTAVNPPIPHASTSQDIFRAAAKESSLAKKIEYAVR
jgi:hypothetical protein